MNPARVSLITRILILWRSLWIQGSWSFKGMQTVGFVHALEPGVTGTREERLKRFAVHLNFFNAHPFLSPMAVGAVVKAEREGDPEAGGIAPVMMGPLGGLGDTLFWGGFKPLAAVLGIFLVAEGFWWAPLAMVAFFAAVGLLTRVYALNLGLSHGKMALLEFQKLKPFFWADRVKLLLSLMLGWVVWRLAEGHAINFGVEPFWAAGAAIGAALVVAWGTRRGADPLVIIYAAAAAALIIGNAI